MKAFLNSTTALGMSALLVLPGPIAAQGELAQCSPVPNTGEIPCAFDGGVLRTPEDVTAVLEALAAEEAAAAEAEAEAEAQAAEEAAAAEAEAAEEAAEAQAAEEAAAAEAEAQAAEEAAAAEAEAQAAEEAAAAEAEAQAAEEAAAAEAEAQAAEEAAAAEAEAQAAEEAAAAEAAELEERRRAAELAAEEEAAAVAALEEDAQDAEVVTEDITEETVRSSDEEFDTDVSGANQAATAEPAQDDGLSKFEKALLLGLGAVVVGSILKNGDKVVSRSGDRVVVENPDGQLRVLKDDDALIRRPGDEVRTETFNDGSSRTIVNKGDGSKIITIRGRDGRVLRRINVDPQGNEFVLFDDTVKEEAVVVTELPKVEERSALASVQNEAALRAALQAELDNGQSRKFSLRQIRQIKEVRALAPQLELDAVRFETGSAAIRPEQARSLARIGTTLSDMIARDPRTVILVEGHTDAVGDAGYNLALSDRRAETVALALTEYFNVPPENLITQGYGESALKISTLRAEPANRRAVVRNITQLLR